MAKVFDRWTPIYPHSIPYRVFTDYDDEIFSLITSLESGKGYIFKHLTADGAVPDSLASDHLLSENNKHLTVRGWTEKYNYFRNWVRMSFLMSCCSMVENYFVCIIKETIESDPGLLISYPHIIDGIKSIKHSAITLQADLDKVIESCTKGLWSSRIAQLKRLYKTLPPILENSVSDLDKIRNIRNDFGHAFGRDIKTSRDYFKTSKTPITPLSIERFNKFHTLLRKIVREFDAFVTVRHIGCYEQLLQLNSIFPEICIYIESEQIERFKTSLFEKGHLCNKSLCKSMIQYYKSL